MTSKGVGIYEFHGEPDLNLKREVAVWCVFCSTIYYPQSTKVQSNKKLW